MRMKDLPAPPFDDHTIHALLVGLTKVAGERAKTVENPPAKMIWEIVHYLLAATLELAVGGDRQVVIQALETVLVGIRAVDAYYAGDQEKVDELVKFGNTLEQIEPTL